MRQPGPFRGPHHEKSTCPQDGQRVLERGDVLGTERGRAEAHALVRECQRAEGGARIRDFRLHACPELAGRLAVAGAHPAPGQQAQRPAIELGNGATSESAPDDATATQMPGDDDAEDHAAHDEGGAHALPRAEIPPLGTPGPRRLAEGGGEVDLVLQAPVDDVAIPAHPERIEKVSQPTPSIQASTHEWASLRRTAKYSPYGFHSPRWKPLTTRAGTPTVRSSTVSAVAKYSQLPERRTNRKSSSGSVLAVRAWVRL